jgi:hypothetical protein
MTERTRPLKRFLVLLPIAAGWLAVLGNSPPPTYERELGARTGPIDITLYGDPEACIARLVLSKPVRTVRWFVDGEPHADLTCVDGTNCLTHLALPVRSGVSHGADEDCDLVTVDAGAEVPDSAAPATAPDAAGGDALAAGDAAPVAGSDAAVLPSPLPEPRPPMFVPGLYRCPGATSLLHEATNEPYCSGGNHAFRLEVETTDGTRSTLDYHLVEHPPPGYFGCN